MLQSLTASLTPDNDGLLVRFMIIVFGTHWKTSLSGLLAFLMATFGSVAAALPGIAILFPDSKKVALWCALGSALLGLFAGLCRVWVGLIQQDSGTVLAKVPNVAEPIAVPSHETPDQKNAVPVIPGKP